MVNASCLKYFFPVPVSPGECLVFRKLNQTNSEQKVATDVDKEG